MWVGTCHLSHGMCKFDFKGTQADLIAKFTILPRFQVGGVKPISSNANFLDHLILKRITLNALLIHL